MTLDELEAMKAGGGHSIFSPSSSAMWLECLGSLVANALADDSSGFDAAEGTVAHAMAELWLRSGKRPTLRTVVENGYTIVVDDAMLAYVEQYVDWCRECRGDHYYEQRVDFSALMPIKGQTGTADHFAATFGELTITDLKYGKGIRVYAENNPQALLYAIAVFMAWDWYYDFQTIRVRICQPRLEHFDIWTIDRAALLAFGDWVSQRAALAWQPAAPRSPSEKACLWCKVKRTCPAYINWFAAIREDEADAVFPVAEVSAAADRAADPFADDPIILPELDIQAWCRILPMRGAVEAWFKAGEARVFAAALTGEAPGYKVVEGRSNRAWVDEADAKARMVEVGIPVDETETRKLLSPNQAEEYLHTATGMPKSKGLKLFESLTERKDGVRSLVRSTDKREALPDYGDVFD